MANLIKKKFIGNNQVDGSKILLENEQFVRAKNQDGSHKNIFKVSSTDKVLFVDAPIVENLGTEEKSLQTKGQVEELISSASQTLQSAIDVEKGRVDAILALSDEDKNSLKELVDLVTSIDTENDQAFAGYVLSNDARVSEVEADLAQEVLDRQSGDVATLESAKNYTDEKIALIPEVDVSSLYAKSEATILEGKVSSLESYSKNIVHVDAVNGVDEIGRGSMLRPFKTINYAYSQVPSLGNPSNTTYNANVAKFVTEKLIISLAPGRYTENVVLGFKRARVQLRGEGATIIGDVKTSVKLADFPCAALENMKASFPAPFTGVSAFMNIEISGNAGGGLESDPTSSVFTITGQASLAFEETTVAGFGTGLNWDSSHGQFYAYLDSVSVGNWVVTSSYTANMTRALPGGVIEVESSNIAASSATYRMFFGAVPYSYLTDFANWNVASKGTTNKAPNSGLTLKAHNSTFGNVIGPALTLGEMDGCRIYDIDRTMRGTVDNGSILGSTSTSYLGFVNNQFRIFSGSGDLASAYKLGQAVGATRYKMDSVSHTTLSFNRSSSGVLTARTLDLGAGVSFDFLDDARSIAVADPATNYTRSASTVDAALEGIDASLGLKANQTSIVTLQAEDLLIRNDIGALDARLDTLEAQGGGSSFSNGSVIVGVELSFVDLDRTYLKLMSCAVGRMAVHEGEDFTTSVVEGKTRLTWIGSLLAPGGAEAIETGDKVFFVGTY